MSLPKKIQNSTKRLLILPELIRQKGGFTDVVRKTFALIRKEGLTGIKRRFFYSELSSEYPNWIRLHDSLDEVSRQHLLEDIDAFPQKPKISIIMPVCDPPFLFLDEAIRSVRRQLYSNWELCIAYERSINRDVKDQLSQYVAGDSRIKVVSQEGDGDISRTYNSVLELATGEFIALLGHTDRLSEHALYYVAKAILKNPEAGIIYSDEDKIDSHRGNRVDPYFKCDWNSELFRAQNFIGNLGTYRRSLVQTVGGFRIGFEGSQAYDLALRCSELIKSYEIVHIPRILYHARIDGSNTVKEGAEKLFAVQSGEQAVREHLERLGIAAEVETTQIDTYRIRYALPDQIPLVSLIIPTRNGYKLLKQCIDSILEKTDYSNYEILIIDNGSDDDEILTYFDTLKKDPAIRVIRDDRPFNYSSLNNSAVKLAGGSVVGLINNDIEVISPDWLTEMVSIAMQPGVGAVGARLWYPSQTLQHGGVILGIGGVAGHFHKHLPMGMTGYFGRAAVTQELSAVTAACLIVKKDIYEEVGGFDEENLAIAFNDIDFCLKLRRAGYRNVWTPYAELYHHESATRGYENSKTKQERVNQEKIFMQEKWSNLLINDPFYNPNLSLNYESIKLSFPPRIKVF